MNVYLIVFFKKNGPTLAFFMFIFLFFSNTILQKNCRLQQDSNSDRRYEGEHADHLTTTTAHVCVPIVVLMAYE